MVIKWWRRILVIILVAAAAITMLMVLERPDIFYRSDQFSREITKRTFVMRALLRAGEQYSQLHDGKPPTSLQQLIKLDPELDVNAPSTVHQELQKVVFMNNVQGGQSSLHRWLAVRLLPKSGWLGPFREDYIYAVGDGELGICVSVAAARKIYGDTVVDAAYQKALTESQ